MAGLTLNDGASASNMQLNENKVACESYPQELPGAATKDNNSSYVQKILGIKRYSNSADRGQLLSGRLARKIA